MKEIRKDPYRIKNKKIKETEENLLQLEHNLSMLKMCFDYDDNEYRRIRDVKNLFDLLIDKDYFKLIITISVFNSNYI